MPQSITIDRPSSVYVSFPAGTPRRFDVLDYSGDVYYFRYLNGQVPRIKFRIPDQGVYTTTAPVVIEKIGPIEIPDSVRDPILPVADRDRWKPFSFVYNKSLDTVARIDTSTGVIEHGPRWKRLIKPMQIFIDEHEKAHMFYVEEWKCDLYALINYIRMGYNESMAYYTLKMVLRVSPEQLQRCSTMYQSIQSNIQSNFDPGV